MTVKATAKSVAVAAIDTAKGVAGAVIATAKSVAVALIARARSDAVPVIDTGKWYSKSITANLNEITAQKSNLQQINK